MNFASDNTAGVAAPILDAMIEANGGFALGYGNDAITERLRQRVDDLFERRVELFLVPTGTAANALAIAQMAPPWGAVLCHEECHLAVDECGAPEFFGGGLKLIGLPGVGGRLASETLEAALARGSWGAPHHVAASVLSLSQPTEAGTAYRPEEIRRLAEIAHARGLKVHIDGARFANALARNGATPAEATWKIGVDVLSLGATKGGALGAEAVIVLDPARADGLVERRKRAGHLVSKHRFLAAQLEAFLSGDLWLDLARSANAMADRLASALAQAGLIPVWPIEATAVFVVLTRALDARLRAAGASYYPWSTRSLPMNIVVGPDEVLVRLVTSFATTEDDVDRFVAVLRNS